MLLLPLLAGCDGSGDPASDYVLTLIPAPLANQVDDLLALEPEVKVRLSTPDGEHRLFSLGAARQGETLDVSELPPVPEGTVVGLIGERPGGPAEEWNRTATVAYGEVTLTEGLALGGKEVELTIPWPRVDAVGRLGALGTGDRRAGAAIARLPGPQGSILLFGGGDPSSLETFDIPPDGAVGLTSSASVFELAPTEDGWGALAEVGTLPATWHGRLNNADTVGIVSGRNVGMSATAVEVDGKPMVLLVGGRYTLDFTPYNQAWWFLWDPETHEVPGGGLTEGDLQRPTTDPGCVAERTCGLLSAGRSDHLAVRLGSNKVLIYGGLIGAGLHTHPSYEIWSAGSRSSVAGSRNSTMIFGEAPYFAAAAPLGTNAVVCGGASWAVAEPLWIWTPSDRCFRFAPNDDVTRIADLPVPLAGAALAPLPDGGLLLTGGFDAVLEEATNGSFQDTAPASAAAWRWDPAADAWARVGDLVDPRAFHQALPLADGRVMLVGGVEEPSVLFGPTAGPVRCGEIFDPADETFTRTSCSDAGAGGFPAVGGDPRAGWALLQGVTTLTQEGASVYGIVGGQPLE